MYSGRARAVEPGRPRVPGARAPARGPRRLLRDGPADRARQRADPVLLSDCCARSASAAADPISGAGEIARRNRNRGQRALGAEESHAVGPDLRDRDGLLEQRRDAARRAHRGSAVRRRASPARRRASSIRGRPRAPPPAPELLGGAEVAGPVGQRRAQHRHAGRHGRAALQERAAVVGGGRRVGPALRSGLLAGVQRQPRLGQAEPWIAPDHLARQRVQPAEHRGAATSLQPGVPRLRDQIRRIGFASCREQVGDRGRDSPAAADQAPARACSSATYSAEHVSSSSRRRTSRNTWW